MEKSKLAFLTLSLAVCAAVSASAQGPSYIGGTRTAGPGGDTVETFPLGPSVVENKTGTRRLVWADGREATVSVGRTRQFSARVPLKFQENGCVSPDIKLPNCSLRVQFSGLTYGIYWTKHPDPKRINMPITAPNGEVLRTIPGVGELHFLAPHLATGAKPALECDSWDWLPVRTISRWELQSMSPNSETGQSDNQNELSMLGVKLAPAGTRLEISSIDKIVAKQAGQIGLFISLDDIAWYLPHPAFGDPSSRSCQMTLRMDFTAVMPDGFSAEELRQMAMNGQIVEPFDETNQIHREIRALVTFNNPRVPSFDTIESFFFRREWLDLKCVGTSYPPFCSQGIDWSQTKERPLQ
ncbi:MAG TPA: hypothetical protein VFV50_00885 [Bdellovibrionales bacterium]|nr:hypothetical protein [Bdellovibrionales bacterium]